MFSQNRDDILLASCCSPAACHHGAEALPVRQQEGWAHGEGLEGISWCLCPGKGWQGVHCPWHGASTSSEKLSIPQREEAVEGQRIAKSLSISQSKRSNRRLQIMCVHKAIITNSQNNRISLRKGPTRVIEPNSSSCTGQLQKVTLCA